MEHIHTVVNESGFWKRQLLFRDYLRLNEYAWDEYLKLKIDLSEKEWETSNDYAYAKSDFNRSIEKEAENYFLGSK